MGLGRDVGRFEADGYPASELRALSYNTAQSNVATAGAIAAELGRCRHPFDGRAVLALLPQEPRRHRERRRLGLDRRPNHGTWTAAACSVLASCRGMLPGSSFLRAHNSGDEIINPDTSVILSGATNGRTACIGHISLLASPRVYAGVRDFVR